ncbi:DUF7503 family protein [Haladaptatus paucihalophilus]|uniref:Uncharacterized protein n=1 Tax=Haladaptatus paucihalophilus DX253 TaxID=797209 RepID=A0A1M6V7U6_HALPU|nr:hypothetical protein SAMN05444342_2138 [Haladaptatus paucihalophilus DX253]
MARQDVATYLAQHPRMIGALFMASLLLMQTTPVLAGGPEVHIGP